MILFACFFIVLFCIVASAFFSGSESGFYFIQKERLSVLVSQGNTKAEKLLKIVNTPAEMICAILIGNNFVLQAATYAAMAGFGYLGWFEGGMKAEIMTTVILFLPFFIFGEVLPKVTFRLYAEPLLLFLIPILNVFNFFLKPVTFITLKLSNALEKQFGTEKEENIVFDRSTLSVNFGNAYAGGVLSEEQMTSLVQALNAESVSVEQIMTPIRKAEPLSIYDDLHKLSVVYKRTQRYVHPVYREKRSNIIGVIDIREVLKKHHGEHLHLIDYLQPAVKIQKGQAFNTLFEIFFKQRIPIVFIHYQDRFIGYINRTDAVLKLLR